MCARLFHKVELKDLGFTQNSNHVWRMKRGEEALLSLCRARDTLKLMHDRSMGSKTWLPMRSKKKSGSISDWQVFAAMYVDKN